MLPACIPYSLRCQTLPPARLPFDPSSRDRLLSPQFNFEDSAQFDCLQAARHPPGQIYTVKVENVL